MFDPPFINNKIKRFSLKVDVSYVWKMVKCITSYSQRSLGKTVLSVYMIVKDILAALQY